MGVSKQQGILTPTVRPQGVDNSEANFKNQLADFAISTAQITADKSNKKYEMDFRNQAQEGINQAYERNQTNPGQLKKELQSVRNGLIKNAPRNLRDSFDESFSSVSRPFMNKATNNHGRIVTDQLKESSLQNLEHGRVAMTRISADFLSNDPVAVADSTKAAQAKIMEMTGTLSEVDLTGQPVFSATERVRLMKGFIDETTFSATREAYDDSEDKQDFLDRFESGEMKVSIFLDEKGNFAEGSLNERMDRATFERTKKYMEKDIKAIKLEGEKQQARQFKLFTEDSAQLVMEQGVDMRDADAVIEAQRNAGVAEGNISIFPNQNAKFRAGQLNGAPDVDTLYVELAKLRAEVGNEHYPRAMKDLKKAGLSNQHSFAAMVGLEDKQVADALFIMGAGGKEIRGQVTAKGDNLISKIKVKVSENIDDTMRIMRSENPTDAAGIATMEQNMVDVATFFVAQGRDVDSATQLATEWWNGRVAVGDVNGKKFRIPEGGFTADGLEPALNGALRNMGLPDRVVNRAGFVLHPDEDRYYLKDDIGAVVMEPSGEPIYFPIADLLRGEFLEKRNIEAKLAATRETLEINKRSREELKAKIEGLD